MAIKEKATESVENKTQVRVLKGVVAGLGLLILLGLAAVFWRMFELASGRVDTTQSPPAPSATTAPAPQTSELTLPLPAGAQIRSTSLDQNRIAVHYDAPSSSGIAIIDLKTGRILANIKTAHEAAR